MTNNEKESIKWKAHTFRDSKTVFFCSDQLYLVKDTGTGISGGYTDKGTPDTDKDTCLRTHHRTRTHIRINPYPSWRVRMSGVAENRYFDYYTKKPTIQ